MLPLDVVICTYNNADVLGRTLEALGKCDDLDMRVIVVDNASSDGTLRLAQEIQGLAVQSLSMNSNQGFSKAVNKGLKLRRPECDVLVLNPDVLVEEDLSKLVAQLGGDVGVISPLLQLESGSVDHACARPEPTPAQAIQYALGLTPALGRLFRRRHWYGQVPTGASSVAAVSGAFMLISSTALDRVGVLDERFWMYGEDLDWCRRFRHAGFRVMFMPAHRAIHLKGASTTGHWNEATLAAFFQSMFLYYEKWYGATRLGQLGLIPLRGLLKVWKWTIARRPTKTTRPL